MATFNVRLNKLEEQAFNKSLSGTEMVLNMLRVIGFDDFCSAVEVHDKSKEHASMPFWMLMNDMDDMNNPFEFERYRGLVPVEQIRLAYNWRRNWAYQMDISTRVRLLAGVIDEDGNLMTGYVLLDNNCIVDA